MVTWLLDHKQFQRDQWSLCYLVNNMHLLCCKLCLSKSSTFLIVVQTSACRMKQCQCFQHTIDQLFLIITSNVRPLNQKSDIMHFKADIFNINKYVSLIAFGLPHCILHAITISDTGPKTSICSFQLNVVTKTRCKKQGENRKKERKKKKKRILWKQDLFLLTWFGFFCRLNVSSVIYLSMLQRFNHTLYLHDKYVTFSCCKAAVYASYIHAHLHEICGKWQIKGQRQHTKTTKFLEVFQCLFCCIYLSIGCCSLTQLRSCHASIIFKKTTINLLTSMVEFYFNWWIMFLRCAYINKVFRLLKQPHSEFMVFRFRYCLQYICYVPISHYDVTLNVGFVWSFIFLYISSLLLAGPVLISFEQLSIYCHFVIVKQHYCLLRVVHMTTIYQ
ncbi:uncharacterized protein [Elaeis guineensis]|uniref:uncharacterized protein n=1 Tax=Elaeis guineensis var. tenera TaxID=51953 RepID=UPI00094FE385